MSLDSGLLESADSSRTAKATRYSGVQAMLKSQLDAQNDRLTRASSAAERRRKALHSHRPEDAALLERSASLAAAQAANKALLTVWPLFQTCSLLLISRAMFRQ